MLNTFHATGVSRCQVQNQKVHKMLKYGRLIEVHYYILNHNGKLIQKSTNMPGIGLEKFEMLRCYRDGE